MTTIGNHPTPHHVRLLESPAGHSIPGLARGHRSTISLSPSLQIHADAKTRSLVIPVSPQTPSRLAMSLTGQSPYLTDHSHAISRRRQSVPVQIQVGPCASDNSHTRDSHDVLPSVPALTERRRSIPGQATAAPPAEVGAVGSQEYSPIPIYRAPPVMSVSHETSQSEYCPDRVILDVGHHSTAPVENDCHRHCRFRSGELAVRLQTYNLRSINRLRFDRHAIDFQQITVSPAPDHRADYRQTLEMP